MICLANIMTIRYKLGQLSPFKVNKITQIARFMGPIWGPPGSRRPQIGPMLASWTLLSGKVSGEKWKTPIYVLVYCTSHTATIVVFGLQSIGRVWLEFPMVLISFSLTRKHGCVYVIYIMYLYDLRYFNGLAFEIYKVVGNHIWLQCRAYLVEHNMNGLRACGH